MSRDKTPLGPALRGLAARERGTLGAHPSLDQWAAYQEGKVEAEEAERLRDHLARCPKCTQLLMEWMSFAGPVPPEGARPIPTGEVEAAWKALRPQLQFQTGEGATPPAGPIEHPAPVESPVRGGLSAIPGGGQAAPAPGSPRRRIPPWLPQMLAAMFFLTTVGLGIQVAKQRSVSPEGQPGLEAGGMIVDLSPIGDAERGGGPAAEPLFWDTAYQLILTPAEPGDFPSYRYVVVEAESPKRIKWQEVKPSDDGTFTLRIREGGLPPGTYRVLLNGVEGGRSALIDEFEFTVKKR